MKAKKQPRFNVDALRALAGDKVFARAEAYSRGGKVEILSIENGRVLAQVAGTQEYRTVLTGAGTNIEGECSCPAFDNWGFCKHMTAVALAANESGAGDVAMVGGTLTRIRDHLRAKDVDALVEMIVALAERDPALFRKLDMAAIPLDVDDKTLEAHARKAFNGAVRTGGYVDYSHAPGWAAEVESALEVIADLLHSGHGKPALRLADHAITRIEKAIEGVDDSDGHCGALLNQAQEIHLAACGIVRPDPVALARDLFIRELEGDYDTFYNAVAIYADVLGESGLGEYRRLAIAAWEKLPPRSGNSKTGYEYSFEYHRLMSILDFFAERDGDVEARIAIRSRDLSSPWNYLQLAEFCLSQDRDGEALRYAEEGLWVFEDAPMDERLVFFTADLLLKTGRKKEASAQLWRAFEQKPSFELYKRLGKLEGKTAGERVIAYLKKRMMKVSPTSWHSQPDLLIHIMMEEKMFDDAWQIVHKYDASSELTQSLARTCEATHPQEVLNVYAERVEELVNVGSNPGYKEAWGLVVRMGKLRGASEHAAYVAELKTRFKRKRNFMKLIG